MDASSPVKKLTLHESHAAAGARFVPFAGYEMPVRYTTIKDEHHAVRRRVGVFDVSHMGEVFVRGKDAIASTNRLLTNDLSTLTDGRALYTAMCKEDGGILDDLIVYRMGPEEVLICVNADNRAKDFAWIASNMTGDAVAVDESDDYVQLAIQGPDALAVVAEVAGQGANDVAPFHIAAGTIAGVDVLLARTGYTGEDGFEIYMPVAGAQVVFDAIQAAGAKFDLAMCGLGARDTLRLEAKYCLYGNDIDETTNPIEAGLSWVVKLDSDFIGRDAVAAVKAAGPSRRLRGLTLEGRGVLRRGYPIYVGDTLVGETTSGGIAPTLDDVSIGLAYIDAAHLDAERVEVEIRGRRLPARVSTKPFYKKSK